MKRVLGLATGLCLLAAVLSAKMDLHWGWRVLLWVGGLAGLVWATWDKVLPETRDETARAAQPGLYEGSQYDGGGGDSSGS